MANILKKKLGWIVSGWLIVLIGLYTWGYVVNAQTPPRPSERTKCSASGLSNRFTRVVLKTGDAVGINSEMKELVNDVFARNICLRRDIFAAMRRVDATASAMRSAVYQCDTDRYDAFEQEYIDAKMEVYYLRRMALKGNYTDFAPNPAVEADMIKKFGPLFKGNEKIVREKTEDLRRRYSNTEKYEECTIVNWEMLQRKLKKIQEGFSSIDEDLDDLGEASTDLGGSFKETFAPNSNKKDANQDNTKEGREGFLQRNLDLKLRAGDIKVNDVLTKKGWNDFTKKLEEKGDKYAKEIEKFVERSFGSRTIEDLYQADDLSKKIYEEEKAAVTSLADLEVLFLEGTGVVADNFLCTIHNMNNEIKGVTKTLSAWQACVELPLKKQCANKPSSKVK